MNVNEAILSQRHANVKALGVFGTHGKRAAPYRLESGVLVKKCSAKHVFKARSSIGIDEVIWQTYKTHVQAIRFELPDGSVREIGADEFERCSFLHGDGILFAKTRFVRIADLRVVQTAPPSGQLQLALLEVGSI